jgi:glycosyltransferase involved in cell wall biosynthesis
MKSGKMTDDSTRILFVRPWGGKFMDIDKQMLAEHFRVQVVNAIWRENKLLSIALVPLRIFRGVLRSDVTYSWFAGVHSYFAVLWSRLLNKKSIVIVGGYEVARVPGIHYGLFSYVFSRLVRYTLNHADIVLTVDDSLKQEAIENIGANGANIRTVPTGYDGNEFRPSGEKQNLALTIGYSRTLDRNRIKGIDVFAECAKALPDIEFVAIGVEGEAFDILANMKIDNLHLLGLVPQSVLHPYFQKAKVYCQFSRHEGLPNALCEAMLCECVPTGTKICGIPTAIGDTGFYAEVGDPKTAIEAIKSALISNKGPEARERIRRLFPLERREREILQAVKDVLGKTAQIEND